MHEAAVLAKTRSGSVSKATPKSLINPRSSLWSKAIIISELRRVHRKGSPMWSRKLRLTYPSLHSAAIHWFGSYPKAVDAAGLDYKTIQKLQTGRWNAQSVRRQLRQLHRSKVPLHHAAMDRDHPALMVAAYRYFGSYGSAVNAAGLNYERIRVRPMPSWDKKRVTGTLQQLDRKQSGLWKRAVRRTEPYLERAADRCYGSYERAARAAGISQKSLQAPPFRIWSPTRITDDLRALYRRNPRLLKPKSLSSHQHRLLQACRRRFGSYKRALQAAGIRYAEVARVTAPPMSAEQVVNSLKDLFERGQDLRYSRLAEHNPRLLEAARQRFGTYRAAVNAAGFDYPPAPPMRHWTAKLVIKTLKDLHRKHADLRYRQFRKARLPLFEGARHYYGTYLDAIKAAGINYMTMVDEQLEKQLPKRRRKEPRGFRA
jgi:hypothetical protein